MLEHYPPWGDVVVLSPGGQTPTAKRILERACQLVAEVGKANEAGHIWLGLQECEPSLVAFVLSKLRPADGKR